MSSANGSGRVLTDASVLRVAADGRRIAGLAGLPDADRGVIRLPLDLALKMATS